MDAAPYDAPTYFAPSYFSAEAGFSAPPPWNGVSPYDTPDYFPPAYFYGIGSATPFPSPASEELIGRDGAAYLALLSLIGDTESFQEVIFGTATQRSEAGSDCYPLAVVTPKSWEEIDDFDPTLIVRRVSFTITIIVKSPDVGSQFDQLDYLAGIIQQVVDRSDLGRNCLAALTRIRAGRYNSSSYFPEQSVDLDGEFSSLIDPLTNYSAILR